MKKILFFVLFVPSYVFADDFTVTISTNSMAVIQKATPNIQVFIQAVVNRSVENLKDEIIRRRLNNPVEKQKIIDSIIEK